MDYVAEIERLAAEHRRRSAVLLAELEDLHRRTAERGREFAERSAADLTRFLAERADDSAHAEVETEPEADERERQEALEREQREAVARSIAARKANDVVRPIDDDEVDPEGEYFRRKSWLV